MIIGYDVFLCELRYPSRLVYNVVNPFDIYWAAAARNCCESI
jgi:hypothetical protein